MLFEALGEITGHPGHAVTKVLWDRNVLGQGINPFKYGV